MSLDEETLYPTLNKSFTEIPTRSRLFSLNPIGIETPYVESLTGYLSRLANEHCVTSGTLIGNEIAPLLNKDYLSSEVKNGGNGFYDCARIINGVGKSAAEFVRVLEELTHRNDLRYLTLSGLSNIIPSRGLLRSNRVWCPVCFGEWSRNGEVVYEPLLWKLQIISHCSKHEVSLQSTCPYCENSLPHLNRQTTPGYCSKCHRWLGVTINPEQNQLPSGRWIETVNKNVEELIVTLQYVKMTHDKKSFMNKIRYFAGELTDGNAAAFAKLLSVPKSTVWEWTNGKSTPTLEGLLKISYLTNVSLSDYLTKDLHEIQISLNEAVPLKRLAKKSKTVICMESIKKELESIVTYFDEKPLSMEQVAKQLNINKRQLYRWYPIFCKKISSKNQEYEKQRKQNRIEIISAQIREITIGLANRGIYPSRRIVELSLSRPGVLREDAMKAAWYSTLEELGLHRK